MNSLRMIVSAFMAFNIVIATDAAIADNAGNDRLRDSFGRYVGSGYFLSEGVAFPYNLTIDFERIDQDSAQVTLISEWKNEKGEPESYVSRHIKKSRDDWTYEILNLEGKLVGSGDCSPSEGAVYCEDRYIDNGWEVSRKGLYREDSKVMSFSGTLVKGKVMHIFVEQAKYSGEVDSESAK